MSNVRLGMPSREAIAGYWGEDPNSCWKCGLQYRNREGTIDRCHIVPVMLGGKHTVDNLVILCRRCHVRAPDVMDPSFMWEFIEKGDEDGWQFFYDLSDLTREFFARPFVPEFMEKFPLGISFGNKRL